nr:cysteine/serine-rich nuclear protein 1-like [Rhipicephalus microplus]
MAEGSALGRSPRRQTKTVTFDKVTVYEFPRAQGFASVPTEGGMTLGLGFRHVEEYSVLIRQHVDQPRLRFGAEQSGDITAVQAVLKDGMTSSYPTPCHSDEPKEVAVERNSQDGQQQLKPLPWHCRRKLLLDSGVRKIDSSEAKECRYIRASRKRCGCECQGQCLREACSCFLNGIPCQVENASFPCSCREQACENPCGRRQYSPDLAHEHYRHTITRLEAEQAAEELSLLGLRLEEAIKDTKQDDFHGLDKLSEDFEEGLLVDRSFVMWEPLAVVPLVSVLDAFAIISSRQQRSLSAQFTHTDH